MDIIQLPPNENSKATGIFSLGKWRDFMNAVLHPESNCHELEKEKENSLQIKQRISPPPTSNSWV